MRLFRVLCLCASVSGCVVPGLDELGEGRCNEDHPCPQGYACSADGLCVKGEPGACADGDTRACGTDEGTCVRGTQTCAAGEWGDCAGETAPVEETCDGQDNDCDGEVDEEGPGAMTFYRDADVDGYGDKDDATTACEAPEGYVANPDDCDDGAALALPGGSEVCDGLDNDCDGTTDDDTPEMMKPWVYRDQDLDGHGNEGMMIRACTPPAGYAAAGDDCNDADADVHPGAQEVCNGADDDCDQQEDEGATLPWYRDQDLDGYGDDADVVQACAPPTGYTGQAGDCDDSRYDVRPGADEICDGLDNDCDLTPDNPPERALVLTAGATTGLSWAWVDGGISAVYSDVAGSVERIFFQRFDGALAPVGAAVELSDPAAVRSHSPSLTVIDDHALVVWADEDGAGTERVLLARVDSGGQLVFLRAGADGGLMPARVVASAPANVAGAPKAAVHDTSSGGIRVLAAWRDPQAGVVRGVIYDDLGQLVTTEATLTPLMVTPGDLDVAALPTSSHEWLLAVNEEEGGTKRTAFRRVSLGLTILETNDTSFNAVGPASGVDAITAPAASDGAVAAWLETEQSGLVHLKRATAPFTGSASTALSAPTSDPVAGLCGTRHNMQVAWTWSQGTPSAIVAWKSGGNLTVSPPDAQAPSVTWDGAANGYAVGYQADRGSSLDLYGRVVCGL